MLTSLSKLMFMWRANVGRKLSAVWSLAALTLASFLIKDVPPEVKSILAGACGTSFTWLVHAQGKVDTEVAKNAGNNGFDGEHPSE